MTLYITPVYYIYLDKFEHWLKSRKRRKPHLIDEPEVPTRDLVASDAND